MAVAFNPSTGSPVAPASDTFSVPGEAPQNYFGLYWGSIDTYNTISFQLNGVPLAGGSFTGADFPPANSDQAAANANEYIDFFFTAGQVYNQVVFGSSQLNFEFDRLAYWQDFGAGISSGPSLGRIASQSQSLARPPSALGVPFHPDLGLLAQRRRELVFAR